MPGSVDLGGAVSNIPSSPILSKNSFNAASGIIVIKGRKYNVRIMVNGEWRDAKVKKDEAAISTISKTVDVAIRGLVTDAGLAKKNFSSAVFNLSGQYCVDGESAETVDDPAAQKTRINDIYTQFQCTINSPGVLKTPSEDDDIDQKSNVSDEIASTADSADIEDVEDDDDDDEEDIDLNKAAEPGPSHHRKIQKSDEEDDEINLENIEAIRLDEVEDENIIAYKEPKSIWNKLFG